MNRTFAVLTLVAAALLRAPTVHAQQAGANPHGELPEGLTCTSCHTTEAWTPLRVEPSFDHGETGFSLDGRHGDATCARCHAGLEFDQVEGDASDCSGCHTDVHQGSITRPCATCHTTDSFSDIDFAVVHPADFPLAGAHLQTSCESCHRNDLGGAFRAIDTECVTCHAGDYLSSSLVDHQTLGFSLDCTECHSARAFRDVQFDHFVLSGGFVLQGRHAGIPCASCHDAPDGTVSTSPTDADDCVACHQSDYDQEHGGSGFPTDCRACHGLSSWDGASFSHSFPIFSGHHRGEWDNCADCHDVPGDYTTFSCFACHSQTKMDDTHRNRRGYAYDSPTCLSCHPDGRAD